MPSDAQLIKRDRYLIDGRVEVITHSTDPPFAHLRVYGSAPGPYEVFFRANMWTCTCPAQITECVHVLVAKLISPLRTSADAPSGLNTNPDIDALLGTGPITGAFEHADDEWHTLIFDPDTDTFSAEDKEW